MVSTFSNMYFIRIYYNYRKPDRTHKILPYFKAVRNKYLNRAYPMSMEKYYTVSLYGIVCNAIFDSTLIKTS